MSLVEPGGSRGPFRPLAVVLGLAVPEPLLPGRAGLPRELTGGRTVLVPTRDPAALTTALPTAVPDTPDRHPGRKGTLGS